MHAEEQQNNELKEPNRNGVDVLAGRQAEIYAERSRSERFIWLIPLAS
jgi:hypothetical protein